MHCPSSNSGCRSIQGIYTRLTGEDLCLIPLCYANIFGVVQYLMHLCLNWTGGIQCSEYSGIQGICAQMTIGSTSAFYIDALSKI